MTVTGMFRKGNKPNRDAAVDNNMLMLKVSSLFELLLGKEIIEPILLLVLFVLFSYPSCVSVCFYYHGKILFSCNVEERY